MVISPGQGDPGGLCVATLMTAFVMIPSMDLWDKRVWCLAMPGKAADTGMSPKGPKETI